LVGVKVDFDVALKEAGERLVAVDFSTTWCRPCRAMKPIFRSLSVKHQDVLFLEVDADECEELLVIFLFTKEDEVSQMSV
uniref:Thioredoxin domain-containing protein n=1 Tax=Sus scrofa TaxID=9823 RepID=A0A4X1VRR0_PIG